MRRRLLSQLPHLPHALFTTTAAAAANPLLAPAGRSSGTGSTNGARSRGGSARRTRSGVTAGAASGRSVTASARPPARRAREETGITSPSFLDASAQVVSGADEEERCATSAAEPALAAAPGTDGRLDEASLATRATGEDLVAEKDGPSQALGVNGRPSGTVGQADCSTESPAVVQPPGATAEYERRSRRLMMRRLFAALVVRTHEAIRGAESRPPPPRVLPMAALLNATDATALESPVAFTQEPLAPLAEDACAVSRPSTPHGTSDVERFVATFVAALRTWSPHTTATQLMIAAAARVPACELASTAAVAAQTERASNTARELARCGAIHMLGDSFVVLCAALASPALSAKTAATGDAARQFADDLMSRLSLAATAPGGQTLFLRGPQPSMHHANAAPLAAVGDGRRRGSKLPRSAEHGTHTLTSVLQFVALELELISSLLHAARAEASPAAPRGVACGAVALRMLYSLTECAEYRFSVSAPRGVPHRKRKGSFAAVSPAHSTAPAQTVSVVSLTGLGALLRFGLEQQQQLGRPDGQGRGNRSGLVTVTSRRGRQELHDVLQAVCALYSCCYPEAVFASSLHRSAEPPTERSGSHSASSLGAELLDCWRVCEGSVRQSGVLAALPWLRLVPSVLTATRLAAQARMELAVRDDSNDSSDSGSSVGGAAPSAMSGVAALQCAGQCLLPVVGADVLAAFKADLAAATSGLSAFTRDLLFYDREQFERQRLARASDAPEGSSGGADAAGAGIADQGDDRDGPAPLARRRGKRSLFYHGEDATRDSVLVGSSAGSSSTGEGRKSRRFVSRGGRQAASHGGARAPGGGRGSSGEQAASVNASSLFSAVVLSQETVPLLAAQYSLDKSGRDTVVEDTWIGIVRAIGQLRRLLYGTRATSSPENAAKQLHTAPGRLAVDLDSGPPRKNAGTSAPQHVEKLPVGGAATEANLARAAELLPAGLRALVDGHPAATPAAQARRRQTVMRLLLEMREAIPLGLLDSLLRVSAPLADALLRIQAFSVQQSHSKVGRAGGAASASYAKGVTMPDRARRRLGLLFVLGVQELIWFDGASLERYRCVWQSRCGALPSASNSLSAEGLSPRWQHTQALLTVRLVDELVRTRRRRTAGAMGQLMAVAKESLACLRSPPLDSSTSAVEASPSEAGRVQALHAIPLGVTGRQAAAVLVLSSLHACTDGAAMQRTAVGGARASGEACSAKEVKHLFDELLCCLESDTGLLLICATPAFLQLLTETATRVGRQCCTGEAERAELHARMHKFAMGTLFPVMVPAIGDALRHAGTNAAASAFSDSGTAGSSDIGPLCELALPLLSALSRLWSRPPPSSSPSRGGESSASGKVLSSLTPVREDDATMQRWGEALMQLGVYCLRHSRQRSVRQAGVFDLASAALPSFGPTRVQPPAAFQSGSGSFTGAYLRFLDLSNDLVLSGAMVPDYLRHDRSATAALSDYLRALDTSALCGSDAHPAPSADASSAEVLERLAASHGAVCRWEAVLADARQEAVRHRPVFAAHVGARDGGSAFAVNSVAPLTRFMDRFTRMSEERVRAAAHRASQESQHASTPFPAAPHAAADSSAGATAIDDAPLLVLDFLGYLTAEGGWPMLNRTLSVCSTAFAVERRRHRHALAEVRETAATAVLSQLRAVPPPSDSLRSTRGAAAALAAAVLAGRALPSTHLSLPLLLSAAALADGVSKDGSLTLLGCSRRDPVTAMLASPSREECRSVLFGVKQLTLYLEAEAQRYREPEQLLLPVTASETGVVHEMDEDQSSVQAAETPSADSQAAEPALGPEQKSYCQFMTAYDESRRGGASPEAPRAPASSAMTKLCVQYRREHRLFVASLVSAIDLNLECARNYALQVEVVDEEMRKLLAASLSALLRLFTEHTAALQRESERDPSGAARFEDEHALLLWAGLCIVASLVQVAQLDESEEFFVAEVRRLSLEASDSTKELFMSIHTATAYPQEPGSTSVPPLTKALLRAVRRLQGSVDAPSSAENDVPLPSRALVRLGLGAHHGRTDFTALLLSLYGPFSCVAAALHDRACGAGTDAASAMADTDAPPANLPVSAAAALAAAAGKLFHGLWSELQGELLLLPPCRAGAAPDGSSGSPKAGTPAAKNRGKALKHRAGTGAQRDEKTAARAGTASSLTVPSVDELKVVLRAFAALEWGGEPSVEGGGASHSAAPQEASVRGSWCCDVDAIACRVSEDRALRARLPSLITSVTAAIQQGGGSQEEAVVDEEANQDELELGDSTALVAAAYAESAAHTASPWAAPFLASFVDVGRALASRHAGTADGEDGEESLEDGESSCAEHGDPATDADLIDQVIQQGKSIRRFSKTSTAGTAPLLVRQVDELMGGFHRNVMAVLQHFPLWHIGQRPGAADGFFAALGAFILPSHEERGSVASSAAGTALAARNDPQEADQTSARSGMRTATTAHERRQALCAILEHKVRAELLEPDNTDFCRTQEELLKAVRVHRTLGKDVDDLPDAVTPSTAARDGATRSRRPSSDDLFAPAREEAQLTQLRVADRLARSTNAPLASLPTRITSAALLMARIADGRLDKDEHTVGLPLHDDIRLPIGAAGDHATAPPTQSPQHAAAAPSVQARLTVKLPMAVVLSLLRPLLSAEKSDPSVYSLAQAVATYAVRRYVLLRPRLSNTAVNTLSVLYDEPGYWADGGTAASSGTAVKLGPRDVQVLVDWRLPRHSSHVKAVSGKLLSPAQERRLRAEYAAAALAGSSSVAEDGLLGALALLPSADLRQPSAFAPAISAEQLAFEYIRGGAVYLHLLSVLSALLYRYEAFGSLPADNLASVRRRHLQRLRAARQEQYRQRGSSVHGGESAAGSSSTSYFGGDAQLQDLREAATLRQTTAAGVNANLLESVLLHFVNVSSVLVRHTDTLTHLAVDRAVAVAAAAGAGAGAGADAAEAALTDFAGELRALVATAFQDAVATITFQSERAAPLPWVHRAVNAVVGRTPCTQLTDAQLGAGDLSTALRRWRADHPEWVSVSPTMLAIVSPHYIVRCLANSLRAAPSQAMTTIANCLGFYAERRDAALSPLLSATTELLTATSLRNSATTVYCERLASSLTTREEFRLALAPPVVASRDQGAAGSVPSEVLVPFVAAIARHDVRVSKRTLAAALGYIMRARADVFGLPPTVDRQGALSLVTVRNAVGGAYDTANPLYPGQPAEHAPPAAIAQGSDGQAKEAAGSQTADSHSDDLAVLDTFTADAGVAALSHRRALAGLGLTLPATMEVAAHLRAMRWPSSAETRQAKSMLRAADDARRERMAAYRSSVHAATAAASFGAGTQEMAAAALTKLDAGLHLADPDDFGVVMLHLRYALRKIVHASYRRLAKHQSPPALASMLEMLLETDDAMRKWWWQTHHSATSRAGEDGRPAGVTSSLTGARTAPLSSDAAREMRRLAVSSGGSARSRSRPSASSSSSSLSASALAVFAGSGGRQSHHALSRSPAPPRDMMLAGTMRVLAARAVTCALAVGYSSGVPMRQPAVSAHGESNEQPLSASARSPVLLPGDVVALDSSTAAGGDDEADSAAAAERGASLTTALSTTPLSHRSRQRVQRALAAARQSNRLLVAAATAKGGKRAGEHRGTRAHGHYRDGRHSH